MFKFIILIFLLPLSIFAKSFDLAVCAIFQDDAKYLPSWIEFHQKQGVEHFYLYNNLSSDDYKKFLNPYMLHGLVDLIEWPKHQNNIGEWNAIQCAAYMDCINKHKKHCKWIAFIDTDEFLFCPRGYKLNDMLHSYKSYAGVSVNWIMYGNGGVERIDRNEKLHLKLVYRSLFCNPVNLHVKTLVQPRYVIDCVNPHYFIYIEGKYAVTEKMKFIDGPFSETNSVELFRINHYWQRDLEFFWNVKVPRQRKWNNRSDEEMKKLLELFNDEFDDILIRL